MNDMKTHSLTSRHRTWRVTDVKGIFLCYRFAKSSTAAIELAKWDFPNAAKAY